jgi:putative tricarboxylic transport membrane protein
VSNSVVDVWIMLIMGGIGYLLRKFGYDLAPVALGLVLAPMLELSLRQSLAMSAGDYSIFVQRPIALTMLSLGAVLLLLGLKPLFSRGRDWRSKVGLEES